MQKKIKAYVDKVLSDYLQDNMPTFSILFILSGLLLSVVAIATCIFGIISYPNNMLVFILESCFVLYISRTILALSCTIYAKLTLSHSRK